MEKNLEKSLKRYLKRKVKITTAFIVAFLLGSLSAYGATLDEIFANGDLVKNPTNNEWFRIKITYDESNKKVTITGEKWEFTLEDWRRESSQEIMLEKLNEAQRKSFCRNRF